MDDAALGIRDDLRHITRHLFDLECHVQRVCMKVRATEGPEFALDLTQRLTQRTLRERIFLLAPEQSDELASR